MYRWSLCKLAQYRDITSNRTVVGIRLALPLSKPQCDRTNPCLAEVEAKSGSLIDTLRHCIQTTPKFDESNMKFSPEPLEFKLVGPMLRRDAGQVRSRPELRLYRQRSTHDNLRVPSRRVSCSPVARIESAGDRRNPVSLPTALLLQANSCRNGATGAASTPQTRSKGCSWSLMCVNVLGRGMRFGFKCWRNMVGTRRLELLTSTVSR